MGFSKLDISKFKIYEFCYDYLVPKYNEKVKLYYMHTDSFLVHDKTEDVYRNISKDFKKRFDTSNYEVDRPFLQKKIEKLFV